jgi:hypothetical protein
MVRLRGDQAKVGAAARDDRPDREQRSHVDRRRTSKARAGRASIQSYARQVDEDSNWAYGKFRQAKHG